MPKHHHSGGPEQLNVLIASESSPEQMNGVSRSVYEVTQYLSANEHMGRLLCPKPAPSDLNGFEVIKADTWQFQGHNVGKLSHRAAAKMLDKGLDGLPYDVLYAASPFWRIGKRVIKAASKAGVPTVAVYQTDIPKFAKLRVGTAGEIFSIDRLVDIHNTADLTLAPSEDARRQLIEYGVKKKKIEIWRRGVDGVLFNPERRTSDAVRQLREQWSPDGLPIVGYVGRLAPEKHVERLDFLRKLGVQLVVVGDGPSRDSVHYALGKGAIMTGELRGDDLANAYAALDIFVHTGVEETFGQTTQEALASGTPVVAPHSAAAKDLLTHGKNGLLYPAELSDTADEAMRENVKWLLTNETKRAAIAAAGRQAVEGRTWAAVGSELVEHLRSVIL